MIGRVALVRTDVSEELSVSIIRMKRIGEIVTLVVTSNRRTPRRNTKSLCIVHRFLSPWWRRRWVPSKRRFLQKPHGVTSQKTSFFVFSSIQKSFLKLFIYRATDKDLKVYSFFLLQPDHLLFNRQYKPVFPKSLSSNSSFSPHIKICLQSSLPHTVTNLLLIVCPGLHRSPESYFMLQCSSLEAFSVHNSIYTALPNLTN
jgi:hypothetical protein